MIILATLALVLLIQIAYYVVRVFTMIHSPDYARQIVPMVPTEIQILDNVYHVIHHVNNVMGQIGSIV